MVDWDCIKIFNQSKDHNRQMFFLILIQSITTLEYVRKRYGGLRIELYLAVLSIILIIFSKAAVNFVKDKYRKKKKILSKC